MPSSATIYQCLHCGSQFSKWSGKCLECGKWNTLNKEEVGVADLASSRKISSAPRRTSAASLTIKTAQKPQDLLQTIHTIKDRLSTSIREFDRVLGGGFVSGSAVVLAGSPGIGKSTLVLRVCERVLQFKRTRQIHAKKNKNAQGVLYISGEESAEQVALRAQRMGIQEHDIQFLNETRVELIEHVIAARKPILVIIDSIQAVQLQDHSQIAGSLLQVRASADRIVSIIKRLGIPTIMISHITKQGLVAGPKTLEHMVDVVLYLEGDKYQSVRVLRATKNRFGATSETGLFEMKASGLEELKNPSKILLAQRSDKNPGSVVSATVDGSRAFLLEVQALTQTTVFGYPKRTANGVPLKRLELLLAVLSKRAGINVSNQDVYVNIAGGFDIKDPGLDLAVCAAVASSYKDKVIASSFIAIGEVGLLGEVRPIHDVEKRVKEAVKLGFTNIIIPPARVKAHKKITIIPVKHLRDCFKKIFYSK